ncbi:MAG: hypothetical protein N3A01_01670 [Bacteroidales bacterium]|nr:hypothetical protein [Bacteroidales bacterium]
MNKILIILTFLAYSNLYSQNDYQHLYKVSDNIFCGYVKNILHTNDSSKIMVDIDITEVQKGKAYKKFLALANNTRNLTLNINHLYIFFIIKNKKSKSYNILYYEPICKGCENFAINEIYKIINKKFFKKVKTPHKINEYNKCRCW